MISKQKNLFFLILLQIIICSVQKISFTDNIRGNGTYMYYHSLGTRIFMYSKETGYEYGKLINYYGTLTLLHPNETIITIIEGGEEEYLFKFEENIYYIMYNETNPFSICGFDYFNSKEELSNILTSSLKLYFFLEREVAIHVPNEQTNQRFVSIIIKVNKITDINPVKAVENSNSFEPLHEQKIINQTGCFVVYFLLKREIIFKPTLININDPPFKHEVDVVIIDASINSISNNDIFCTSGNLSFYRMENNNLEYYMLFFKQDAELYFYINNFNIEKIYSGEIGIVSNNIFYFNTTKERKCFSLKYVNEKNLIEEGNFSVILFEPSFYNFTIKKSNSNIKSVEFIFIKDNIYELKNFYYGNIKIPYSYLEKDYYFYYFNLIENEVSIQLEFKNISTIDKSDYHTVQLFYKTLNYSIIDIKDNYEECLIKQQMYILYPQESKRKVYIAHNSTDLSDFKINGKIQSSNSFLININELNYIYIHGQENNPIFISFIYFEKDIIDLNLFNSFTFNLITNQKYIFSLTELSDDYDIILNIYSKYNYTNSNISLEGAISESGSKTIINAKEYNILIVRSDKITAEIIFGLINNTKFDEITISYNYKLDLDYIKGSGVIFFETPIKEKNYELLTLENNIYYEIINYYGNILLFQDDELISNLTGSEQSYYFKHNNSKYILQFSTPIPFQKSGFQIVCSNKERNILTSSLDLYLFKEREFKLIVKNEKDDTRFISLNLEVFNNGPAFNSAHLIENGTTSKPIYEEIEQNNKNYIIFYIYLNTELIFKPTLFNNQSSITTSTKTTIFLYDVSIKNILNDNIIYTSGNLSFYRMENTLGYYIISFKKDVELYFYKNNYNIEKINSGEIGIISNDDIFYFKTTNTKRCFSIKFVDEKNSLEIEGDFNITLFESSPYNFTIKNFDSNIKTVQIKYKQNDYYQISHFFYQNIEINYLYIDEDNYYLYSFNHTENEIAIHLEFENISDIDSLDYYDVQLSYKPLNYSLKDIKDNYEECLIKEQMYILYPKESKQKVYIAHNSTDLNNFKINGKKQSSNSFWIDVNKVNYIYIFAETNNPIFFTLIYNDKEIIDLNLNNNFSFYLITNQKLKFNFIDLNDDYNITLHIYSKYNNVNSNITLEGAISELGSNLITNAKEYNTIIINNTTVLADIQFSPSNLDEITISYNLTINYDIINGSVSVFFDSLIKVKYYQLLPLENNIYYEIINYYGNILLFLENEIISNLTGGEQSYYFKHNNSNFILKFNTPIPFQKSGFQIICSSEERNILINSLDLYLFKEREYEIIIRNKQENKRIISLNIEVFNNGLNFSSAQAIENRITFEPIYKEIEQNSRYYIVFDLYLNTELIFKPFLFNNQNHSFISKTTITLNDISITKLSNENLICPSGNVSYYQMSSFLGYYILSFKKDAELYFYKNNTDLEKINSGEISTISNNIFYFNTTKEKRCFYIKFVDEKNTIKEGDFNIILFESSSYNFSINNSNSNIKSIQLKFKNNNYSKISHFSYLNKEINYSYLDEQNYYSYYLYHLNQTVSEISIHLEFENISNINSSKYYKVELSYKSFNSDFTDISNNYKNMLLKDNMYILHPNESRQKVYIAHNSLNLNNVTINGKSTKSNSFWMDVKELTYIYAYAKKNLPLFIYFIYNDKDIFDLNLNNSFSFYLVSNQRFKINFTELNNDYDIILHINPTNNLTDIIPNLIITLEGGLSESGSNIIINANESTRIIINNTILIAGLHFNSEKYYLLVEFVISYKYIPKKYDKIIGPYFKFFDSSLNTKNYQLLPLKNNIYYEIISYYGNILLFQDGEIISNLIGGEQSFYFKYNNNFEYILQFSTPIPFQKSGFQILCSNKERNILISSLDLYLFKEREFELIVKNNEENKRLVSVETSISYFDDLKIETVSGIENGETFIPLSDSNYYYLILKKELTFKIKISNIKENPDSSNLFQIFLKEKPVTNILDSGIITPASGISFYKIFNSIGYYTLYFQDEIPLYNFENNTKVIKAQSNSRKKISDYELLYYNYSISNESFYVDFLDEKNTKKEEGNFSIILYEPIQYDFRLVNTKEEAKRIQIKFKQNNYYSISRFEIANQNSEIKYLFLDSDNYYVYQFKKTSNEIPISLHFSELKESEDSIQIDLVYNSFNNDMIEIKQDYPYNCTTSEEMYEIQYDINKHFIELTYNTSSDYLKLNGRGQNNQIFIPMTKNNYLNILGNPEKNICFQIMFYEKDIFDLKLEQELNFTIIMEQNYTLKISDIEEYNDVELYIKTENDNLEVVNIYLSGETQSITKNDNIYNCTLVEPNKEMILNFKFIPKENSDKEKVTIYYKLTKRTTIIETFVNYVYYYTYASFGLFALSLIIFGIEKFTRITKKPIYSRILERLGSVYLCKND